MKHYLMVGGEKFPVMGITFKMDGDISTIQIIDDYQIKSFMNIDSEEEGAEKIDFATCYVVEDTEAIERVKNRLEEVEGDLNDIAHAVIPSPGEEVDIREIKELWTMYHFLRAYRDGLGMRLDLLEDK